MRKLDRRGEGMIRMLKSYVKRGGEIGEEKKRVWVKKGFASRINH